MAMSGEMQSPVALPSEKNFSMRHSGTKSRSGCTREEKNPLSLPGFEPRNFQSAAWPLLLPTLSR